MIGRTISHYRITAELGRGGMGVVYESDDLKLPRKVALKFLPLDLTRDPQAKRRFVNEAEAASSLQHPNLCTIFEIDETDDGQLFLAMPRYEGRTLKDVLADGPLSTDRALDIAQQLASGLAKAHAGGIVHRDVKPGNVFLTDDGHVVLLDFGLAKLSGATQLTRTGTTLGTPMYLSPEQSRGEETDARTDIWALGVVLYEMLVGRAPFAGEHPQALIYAIQNERPAPLTSVPAPVRKIVDRCLQKNPKDRYGKMDDLRIDLERVRSGKRPRMRRPWLVAIPQIVAALAIIVAQLLPDGDEDSRPDPAQQLEAEQQAVAGMLAVLPFEYRGSADYAYLDQGLMDLLITNLDGLGETRTIDGVAVAAALERLGEPYRRTEAARVAEMIGTRRYVAGDIVEAGGRVRVNAGLFDREDGNAQVVRATAEGMVEDLFRLVDDLSGQLLVDAEKNPLESWEQAARMSTTSLPALKAYLKGERLFREIWSDPEQRNLGRADSLFQIAAALDDSFALAWYRLAEIHGFDNPFHDESIVSTMQRAMSLAHRLPERERLLLEADYARTIGDFDRAERNFRQILETHPRDLDALSGLAIHLFQTNLFRGRTWREAIPYSQRFLEINPWWRRAAELGAMEQGWICRFIQMLHAADEGAWARFDSLGYGDESPGIHVRAIRAFGSGDVAAQQAIVTELDATHYDLLVQLSAGFVSTLPGHLEDGRRLTRLLLEPHREPRSRTIGHVALAGAAAVEGRWQLARSHLDSAERFEPDQPLSYRSLLATFSFVPTAQDELLDLRRRILNWDREAPPQIDDQSVWRDRSGYHNLTRLYLLGLVEYRLGHEVATLACAAQLDTLHTERDTGSSARDLARGLRARVAQARGNTDEALRLLESAERRVPLGLQSNNPITGQPVERLFRAELLLELGRYEEARRWFESLVPYDWGLGAVAYLGQARALAALGRPEDAVEKYKRYLTLMQACDPESRPQVEKVRQEMTQLL